MVNRSRLNTTVGFQHFGWLMKKGNRRFFVLDRGVLYWLPRECTTSSSSSVNLRAEATGSLELQDCTVTRLDNTAFELTTRSGTSYVLRGALRSDIDAWMDSIRAALAAVGVAGVDAESEVGSCDLYVLSLTLYI